MKLFKNVDLDDLSEILKEGIKSLDTSGNDNWSENKRAPNPTDVVYLFSPKEKNYCEQYGIVLLEVEVDDVKKIEQFEYDYNKDLYYEYVTDYVSPEKIKNIYIPDIFKERVKAYLNENIFNRITFVELEANYYKGWEKVKATDEVLDVFAKTAAIETANEFNFFRGSLESRKMIDLYDIEIRIKEERK